MERLRGNPYADAVAGYPSSWFIVKGILRRIRRLPYWLKIILCTIAAVTIGVQTYGGMELAHAAVSHAPTPGIRWDCINTSPLAVHELSLIVYRLLPFVVWSLQALNATILPAIGVALSVAVITLVMGEDGTGADVDIRRWALMFYPVVSVLIAFIVLVFALDFAGQSMHYKCPPFRAHHIAQGAASPQ